MGLARTGHSPTAPGKNIQDLVEQLPVEDIVPVLIFQKLFVHVLHTNYCSCQEIKHFSFTDGHFMCLMGSFLKKAPALAVSRAG